MHQHRHRQPAADVQPGKNLDTDIHVRRTFLDRVEVGEIKLVAQLQLAHRLTGADEAFVVTDHRIASGVMLNHVLDLREVRFQQALDELGLVGFDPVYGARPLKREIQKSIENPLAQALLAGEFSPGDQIRIDVDEHKAFVFNH